MTNGETQAGRWLDESQTDGKFLAENIEHVDFMLDPGRYGSCRLDQDRIEV